MIEFQKWLGTFLQGKTEITLPSMLPDKFSVHSVRRFLEDGNRVWEIAFTYTGRLVVRHGRIETDGVTVHWGDWATEHGVDISKAVR